MKLPLYHRPSALAFLDDELSYLDTLALALPRHWCIRFYSRIDDFKHDLNTQALLWEQDLQVHRQMIQDWHAGQKLPLLLRRYWAHDSQRYSLPSIGVVDYSMPAANGLQVLQDCPAWPAWRMLLTGQADEHIAIAAFNEGWIQRYVPKQRFDLALHLINILRTQLGAALPEYQSIWRNILRPNQDTALQDRSVQRSLQDWIKEQDGVEYAVLSDPFGMLLLDREGQAHWLQLELRKDLQTSVDLAQAAGHDRSAMTLITQGEALSNVEWLTSIGQSASKKRIAPTLSWGVGGHVLAAHFPLPEWGIVGKPYREVLSAFKERCIDDDPL